MYGSGIALAAYVKIMMELLIQHYVFDISTSFRKWYILFQNLTDIPPTFNTHEE